MPDVPAWWQSMSEAQRHAWRCLLFSGLFPQPAEDQVEEELPLLGGESIDARGDLH